MPFIQVRISAEDKAELETAARVLGISLSDFMRQSARLAASPNYVTIHVDAYTSFVSRMVHLPLRRLIEAGLMKDVEGDLEEGQN